MDDFDVDNILLDEKSYENVLVYNITCKNLISGNIFRISFDKTDGFTWVSEGARYLVLFGAEK